jgi:hypothetical protein
MKLTLIFLVLLGSACAVPITHSPNIDGISLLAAYPSVVSDVFNTWKDAGLPDASQCDPQDVKIFYVPQAQYSTEHPNTCAIFSADAWIILLPDSPKPNSDTIAHEMVHWLAGCTGLDPDYDLQHRDARLYGPTGIVVKATPTSSRGC